ncbi:MAG: cbb3-type cytochrome c oxidase N-terminal domain-containing protein [Niabella sp.]
MKQLNSIHKSILLLTGLTGFLPAMAQDQASATPAAGPATFTLDVNIILIGVAALLFLVIAALGYTLIASLDLYKKRKNIKGPGEQVIKSMLLIVVCLGSLQVWGQSGDTVTAVSTGSPFSEASVFRYLLLGIIVLELIAIFALVYWIRFFTGIEDLQKEKAAVRRKAFKGLPAWWVRANKLKPIEEEATLDVGHSYDGIRELDNATPPWFTIAFITSIIFGLGYLWRYHVAESAPNQYEEYEIAVTKANMQLEAYMKLKGDAVDEKTVKMLDAAGIESGKKLFLNNCTACHGNAGQGIVGPNLTDDYWLHGGSIGSVFHTIKFGVVEKGMMSWKDVFSAEQIAELASYIKSIQGTHPAGAKEPQGALYKEEATQTDSTATTIQADSAGIAKK